MDSPPAPANGASAPPSADSSTSRRNTILLSLGLGSSTTRRNTILLSLGLGQVTSLLLAVINVTS